MRSLERSYQYYANALMLAAHVFCPTSIALNAAMLLRLNILPEFDVFGKSFIYLASRLSRCQLLEPFTDEAQTAVEYAVAVATMHASTATAGKSDAMCIADDGSLFQQLNLSTGCYQAPAAVGVDAPLSDAEPDTFPCLLAVGGSTCIFIKVCFFISVFIIFSIK